MAEIYNLPIDASEQFARAQRFNEANVGTISDSSVAVRAQTPVDTSIQVSHLEDVAGGFLGQWHTLALYTKPQAGLNPTVFTHTVFLALLNKDKDAVTGNLTRLATPETREKIHKVITALDELMTLNTMGGDAYGRIRQLTHG
jgi:hypothetical protein